MKLYPKSTEQIQDLVNAMLVAGTGVTLAYNDGAGTLTISASGGDLSGYATISYVDTALDDYATISSLNGSLSNLDAGNLVAGTVAIARLPTGTTSSTVCIGNDSRLSDARTPTSHVHGNITNAGAIGSTSGLVVVTTTSGVLTASSTPAIGAATGTTLVLSGACTAASYDAGIGRYGAGFWWSSGYNICYAALAVGLLSFRNWNETAGYGLLANASGVLEIRNLANSGRGSVIMADITLTPSSSRTPSANGDLVVEATSNTSLTFKLKGTDGTVRSGSITLS